MYVAVCIGKVLILFYPTLLKLYVSLRDQHSLIILHSSHFYDKNFQEAKLLYNSLCLSVRQAVSTYLYWEMYITSIPFFYETLTIDLNLNFLFVHPWFFCALLPMYVVILVIKYDIQAKLYIKLLKYRIQYKDILSFLGFD